MLRPPVPVGPPAGIDAWCAPFSYEGVARELVARVKYRDTRAAVPWLVGAMAVMVEERGLVDVDVVTWPPTAAARRRDRGFDHAHHLALELARRIDRPARALLQREGGEAQTGRPSAQRRSGGPRFRAIRAPARVLLVDDVATTGTTLRSAATALRAAGTVWVGAATAARTPTLR